MCAAVAKNIEWLFVKGKLTDEQIKKVENELGIIFPADYIKCVKENNGGRPRPGSFDLEGRAGISLKALLPLDLDLKGNLLEVRSWILDRLPPDVIPVLSDNFGNYVCLDYRPGKYSPVIVFWDHELAYTGIDKGIKPICDNFEEFLGLIY